MENIREELQSNIRDLSGQLTQAARAYYDSFELLDACGVTVFRGYHRRDGQTSVVVFRFDAYGNNFEPAKFDTKTRREWVTRLFYAKQEPAQIMLFLDTDLNVLELDLQSI